MADLSPTSETWWEEVVKVAKEWMDYTLARALSRLFPNLLKSVSRTVSGYETTSAR